MDTKNAGWIARGAKCPRGRPPTRWADVFVARMDQLNTQLVTSDLSGPCERRRCTLLPTLWMTIAKDSNGWKQCCGLHDK
ncbi:unnamed protein product [Strongylus vulgaris]|uniref:Uncharacterized protein n=1 Tax=Strongylus vulgaris TaxID=40348 RepID=A0A3P7L793_STRVU|nr:unnamed protein product [Strongylus vulgaris]